MCADKQKIIQKRVQRRERYARMTRIRIRKQANIALAKSETLADIEKCSDVRLIHQYCPGIFFGERDGKVECEPSMLNKGYLSNCISVVKEGDTKLIRLKLCKGKSELRFPKPEKLDEWEKKDNPDWGIWARRFRNFSGIYENFLVKHQEKFTTGNLDKASTARYNSYLKQREELISTKAVVEMRTRFDNVEDYVSEMIFSQRSLEDLGYTLDEWVDKILKEGIPRVKASEKDNGFLLSKMMENFESLFEKPLEIVVPFESRLLGKDGHMTTGKFTFILNGYFYKKKAELSYIIMQENCSTMPDNQEYIESLHIPIVKKEHLENVEGKSFLEKYYKDEFPVPHNSDGFREPLKPASEATAEQSLKMESEDMGVKEELPEEGQNLNNFYASTNQNNLNAVYNPENTLMTPTEYYNNAQMLRNLYNAQLQSYLFSCQNNPSNFSNK